MFSYIKADILTLAIIIACSACFNFNLVADDTNDPAMEKYYSANALYNKKLYKLAIEEYKNFLARYPDHPKYLSAKLGLALSYYEVGNYRKAAPVFAELAEEKSAPHQEEIHNLLGQCMLIFNKPNEAEAAFRWSVNRGKERFFLDLPGVGKKYQESPKVSMAGIQDLEPLERSLAGLIEALYQQKKRKEVIKTTKYLAKLVPKGKYTTRAKLLSALSDYELKNYKAAAVTLKQLTKEKNSPYMEHAVFLLAECQRKLNNLSDAEKNYQTVAKKIKGKFTSNALFRLGYIKFQQKKYKSAIIDFSDLRAIYSRSKFAPQAGVYLGRSYLELSDFNEAQSIFGSLTNDPSVDAEATLWLAKTFSRQKKFNEATDILKSAVAKYSRNPLFPNLLFDFGNALMGINNYSAAAQAFDKASKVAKGEKLNADSLRLKAYCLNRCDKYAMSLAACDTFLKKYKNDPYEKDTLFLKAENLFFLNKTTEANEVYKLFIPWEGKEKYTDEARLRMAQGLIRTKQYNEALRGLEPLLKENLTDSFFEQVYYLAGFCAFKLQRWQEAISYFGTFIDKYPNKENADSALMNEAMAYSQINNYNEAIAKLNKLIANYQDSPHIDHAYMELGKFLYDKKDYKKAKVALKQVVTTYRDSKFLPYAEYYLGWIAVEQGNTDKAIDHFSKVIKRYPKHKLAANSLFQKSMMLIKKEDYKQALKELGGFLKAHQKSSDQEEALFYYGIALSKLGRNEAAQKTFKKFIVNYPKSKLKSRAMYLMAWISRDLKQPLNAQDYYKALLKGNPPEELANRAMFELAEVEYEQKNYDDAISLLDKLTARDIPSDLKERVIYRMGWCLLGRKQTVPAVEAFEQLLERFPNSSLAPVAAYQAGEGRLDEKDFESAYKHFYKAVKSGKNSEIRPQALLRLGETETLTNRWNAAEKTFLTFLKDYPNDKFKPRAFLWLGWSQENLKKYKQAIGNYQMVLKDNRKDDLSARSQFQIGECYFALKDYDKAIKAFVKVELNYTSKLWVPKAMLEVGQVLIKKNMDKEANEQLKKLVKTYPETDEANLARELLVQRKSYNVN